MKISNQRRGRLRIGPCLASVVSVLLWLSFPFCLLAQEKAPLVTYGPDSPGVEGDPDKTQVFFIGVDSRQAGELYLRIFDPDCGGSLDTAYRRFNTTTRFSLLGGEGVLSGGRARTATPDEATLMEGTLIAEAIYGADPGTDNSWISFASFRSEEGEQVEGRSYFKLVVQGRSGDDGNVYDLAVSTSSAVNRIPDDIEVVTYAPTFRLPSPVPYAEARLLLPPQSRSFTVSNFDAAGARVTLETPLRSVSLTASGQGNWSRQAVTLEDPESGRPVAVMLRGGGELPNDVTLAATTSAGEDVGIQLPIRLWEQNARPRIHVEMTPLADCHSVAFDASKTTDPDGDSLDYRWWFGDGATAEGRLATHRYEGAGTYFGRLEVFDSSGRVGNGAASSLTVFVNRPPLARAGADRVVAPGVPVLFTDAGSSDEEGPLSRFLWDFDDGSQAAGRSVSHVFSRPGRYQVNLRVTDNSSGPCNFAVDQMEVLVNSAPVAEAGEDILVAAREAVRLDGSRSYDVDGELVGFEWELGDGASSQGSRVEHAYLSPGDYEVELRVTDDSGVANSTARDRLRVRVNDPPVARLEGGDRAAIGEAVALDASTSSDADGTLLQYEWDFGDGTSARGERVHYAYPKSGRYEVTLTVRDNSGTSSSTATERWVVVVNEPPQAAAGEDRLSTESLIRFDGTASSDQDGAIIGYQWDFGDGTTSSEARPLHVYRQPGQYRVRLAVKDDSGTLTESARDDLLVVLNSLPLADGGPDRIGSPGQLLSFSGAGSVDPDGEIAEYQWSFGDGTEGEGREVEHAFQKPGVYTVKLTVRDDTGHPEAVDFDEVRVTINEAPVANAGRPLVLAPGEVTRFDAGASIDRDGAVARYQWLFSDRTEPVDQAVVERSFASPGIYTARLIVTDDSGALNSTAQDEIRIRVNQAPRAIPGGEVRLCDTTVSLDGSASSDPDGDSLTYLWNFGDGSEPATGPFVTHTFAEGGSYPVTLTVNDGSGVANASHTAATTVFINQAPVAEAGENTRICAGDVLLLDAGASLDPEGGLLRYRWNFGDETEAFGINPTKVYERPGNYPVTLTVEDDSALTCNQDTDQIFVEVLESVLADAGEDRQVCVGEIVQFDGSASRDIDGVVNRFIWDFGDGTTGGGATPTHGYSEAGTYRVRLTVEGERIADCTNFSNDEIVVNVAAAPEPRFIVPSRVAQGEPLNFQASVSGTDAVSEWLWDFGDGSTARGASVTHSFEEFGKFLVTLTVKAEGARGCGEVSTRQQVIVNASPLAEAGEDQVAGVLEEVLLSGAASSDPDGGIASYEWDFGDGSGAAGVSVRHRYSEPGRYRVSLNVTDNAGVANSSRSDDLWVTVNGTPEPAISGDREVCVDESVDFNGLGSSDRDGAIDDYWWSFGDGETAQGSQVSHRFRSPGDYQVTLRVRDDSSVENNRKEVTELIRVNAAPVARPGPPRTVCPGEPVPFDGSLSYDPGGRIVDYLWDFGDGGQGSGARVNHVFATSGTYEVALRVVDDSQTSCGEDRETVAVKVNGAPSADAGGDIRGFSGGANDGILFHADGSTDPDGDPLTYNWDFGDGEKGAGETVFHRYRRPGTYDVTLTVSDNQGVSCSESSHRIVVRVEGR